MTTATQQPGRAGLMAPRANTPQAPAQASSGNYQIQPATAQPATAAPATTAATPNTPATTQATPAATQTPEPSTPAPAPATPTTTPTLTARGDLQANETVEGRMNALTSSNSPYMNLARDYALRDMNKRGLMQSSIAVGAAHEAAIRNALPIAQQDAQSQFTINNNADLHRFDMAKTASDKALTQKEYTSMGAASNDRYAQEFTRIQESSLTPEQKDSAVAALKQWKVANDNWLNFAFKHVEGIQLNLQPFFTDTSTPATPAATPAVTQSGGRVFTGPSGVEAIDTAALHADAARELDQAANSAARHTSGNAVIDGIARQAELLGLGDGVTNAVNNARNQWREIW